MLKRLFVALSMVAVALSGCTAEGESFREPAPAWKPGYVWAYETTVEGQWSETYDGERDNGTYDDAYRQVFEVLNTTQVIKGEPVYLMAYNFNDRGSSLLAQRQSDLGTLWLDWDACRDADCLEALTLEMWMEHEDVPSAYRFPLTGDSAWTQIIAEEEDLFDIRFQFSSRVKGLETVETPLGPIDAIAVQRTMRIQNLQEVLDGLREGMEENGARVLELDGEYTIRGTDYYAPVYQNAVLSVTEEISRFDLVAEYEGERYEERESSKDTTTSTLTGARLQAGPEKDMRAILGLLVGETVISDPTGQVVEDDGYTLTIDVVRDEVNVADEEMLHFRAAVEGDLPSDHELVWGVFDAVGTTVATGRGMELQEAPVVPGVYTVLVQSMAGGQPVQSAVATGVGHYRTTLASPCGPLEVGGLDAPSGCLQHAIPVRPGIASLDILAMTTSPVDVANRATIRVVDVTGTAIDADDQGNAKHLQMSDQLSSYAMAGSDWTLDWHQTLGVAESQVTFEVDLTYGAGLEAALTVGMSGGVDRSPRGLDLPTWLQGSNSLL